MSRGAPPPGFRASAATEAAAGRRGLRRRRRRWRRGGPSRARRARRRRRADRAEQRLCLLRSSLERRNQSRGRGWEGSGAGAWAGEGDRGATGVAVATVRRRDSWEGAVRPGAAGAERSGGREPGAGAGPARAPGCGTRPPAPRLASAGLSPAIPGPAAPSGGKNSREGKEGEEGRRGTGEGGLAGRSLTGLLTVKRENFPGMREFGGREQCSGRYRWGPGRKSARGAGCSVEGCPTRLPAQRTLKALLSCG